MDINRLNEVNAEDIDLSSFEIKKKLHPKMWVNGKMNPRARLRLLKIVNDFIKKLKINPIYWEDTLLLGSLTNYNWSKYSDIDLHVLIDFKKIDDDVVFVKDYFDDKRKLWNLEHERLRIYGFPVEMYIQDINEENASNGIYSIEKDMWIKKPSHQNKTFNRKKVKLKSSDIMTIIDDLCDKHENITSIEDLEHTSEIVKRMFDKIKRMRKSGLNSRDGEFSMGNIIFKVLRRSGYITKLIEIKRDTYDKINSI